MSLQLFQRTLQLSCLVVALILSASAADAAWEYRSDLGGWLDTQSGLVWGGHSWEVTGGTMTWTYAAKTHVPNYRSATGNSAWRLPTIAELVAAGQNGAGSAVT